MFVIWTVLKEDGQFSPLAYTFLLSRYVVFTMLFCFECLLVAYNERQTSYPSLMVGHTMGQNTKKQDYNLKLQKQMQPQQVWMYPESLYQHSLTRFSLILAFADLEWRPQMLDLYNTRSDAESSIDTKVLDRLTAGR